MSASESAFAALPPVRPQCLVSVAIPARDERDFIVATVEAFFRQLGSDGRAFDPDAFEVIVFANDCTDDTGAQVRALARRRPQFAVHVVEAPLAPFASHVGYARRSAMNAAAARVQWASSRGIVATTDADTVVSPVWIAETIAELALVEALGGRVVPAPLAERSADGERRTYALEHRYRYAVVRLETLLDPVAHDPWPRHGNHQGASLALRVAAYRQVGGTPPLPVLEDLALYKALLRADVSFRHSLRVRVTTSGRRTSRVEGGFAAQLHAIDAHVDGRATYLVEHPAETIALFEGRSALRRADPLAAGRAYGLTRDAVVRQIGKAATLGCAIEALEREAQLAGGLRAYARVPIDVAIRTLESYAESLSSAARPTRIKA